MKTCTGCLQQKSLDQFNKQSANKDGLTYYCKTCATDRAQAHYYRTTKRQRRKPGRTPEEIREVDRNRGKWHLLSEREKEMSRAAFRRWSKKYPEKVRQRARLREARVAHHRPKWANRKIMDAIYKVASIAKQATDINFTVDHIVPLKSKLVCGLHVEHNLTILEASANSSKGNKFWPDMP